MQVDDYKSECQNSESLDVTLSTDKKIKIEQSEIDSAKIDDMLSDVNTGNRLDGLGLPVCRVKGEKNVESRDTNIDIEFVHVKSEFEDVTYEAKETIIKHEGEIDQDMIDTKIEKLACDSEDQSMYADEYCKYLTVDKGSSSFFKCGKCEYQNRKKRNLRRHMLVHKDPSQVRMFKCNECSFDTKFKERLKQHMLVHQDPLQVRMFKCQECNHQSKYKGHLKQHMLVHKNTSQVQTFKCTECSFESKYKKSLTQHILVHSDPFFKCTQCSFESKHERNLKDHMQVHKDPSQVERFKCSDCSRQFKHKCTLNRHMLIHKDPSQIRLKRIS